MNRPELNDDFRDMLAALAEAEVEFLVVGAHALAVHGIVRSTGDLDIFVRPSRGNARRVVEALRIFGAPLVAHGVDAADFEKVEAVYQIGLPPRRIDLLTSITGVSFDEALEHAVSVPIDERTVRVIGRAALLRNKRATGRDKDRLDADELERQPAED